ncbi:MAG TPA: hypothetical protein VK507_03710 [Iamia sp.]|nr:hypothetical protein [Iamia sp.]
MEPLFPQPGSTIAPANAVGRDRTTDRARRAFAAGSNLGINDPRRMGKTVWLDILCADPGPGLLAVKVDYEGVRTSEEFLLRTVKALDAFQGTPQRARARLSALFQGVEVAGAVPGTPISVKVGVSTRTPTDLLGETLAAVADHLDEGVLLVVAMDEVPVAIDNIAINEGAASANQLLQALRDMRRREGRLRWIVCGSIGFHHILRRCGATEGAINDLVNLPLGPLDETEARELAARLCLGIGRPAAPEVVAALTEEAGRIPFLIHALAHHLHEAGSGPISVGDVATAFEDFIDDRDESKAVTHLVTRLDPLYGDRTKVAEAMLDEVARQGAVALTDLVAAHPGEPVGAILDDLVDDHYLLVRQSMVGWRYPVLRRIWVSRRRLVP